MRACTIAAVVVAMVAVAAAASASESPSQLVDGCAYAHSAKTAWNLNPLHTSEVLTEVIGNFTYDYKVCGTVPMSPYGEGCSDNKTDNAAMYQRVTKGNTCAAMMSKWTGSPQWGLIDATDSSQGIEYTTNDGTVCDNEGIKLPRQVTWRFRCDMSADKPTPLTIVEEESNVTECLTVFEIKTKCGCPNSECAGHGGGGGGGGLSGGWVFIIILFVTGLLYGVVGCALNHRKGATGAEMCPNYEFWTGLPGLVRDGFRFTVDKVRGGGGSGDSYQRT